MKIAIVTGTRGRLTAFDRRRISEDIGTFDHFIIGDCPTGVDAFVQEWIEDDGWQPTYKQLVADWEGLGRAAGLTRNTAMICWALEMLTPRDELVCLAYPSKGSKGTWDCLKKAVGAGIETRVVLVG